MKRKPRHREYEKPYRPEGIEREDIKNTKGIHWTREELREFIANMPRYEAIEEMRGNRR